MGPVTTRFKGSFTTKSAKLNGTWDGNTSVNNLGQLLDTHSTTAHSRHHGDHAMTLIASRGQLPRCGLDTASQQQKRTRIMATISSRRAQQLAVEFEAAVEEFESLVDGLTLEAWAKAWPQLAQLVTWR